MAGGVSVRQGNQLRAGIREILRGSLERRIAPQVSEQVPEDTVVKNAVSHPEGGFAVLERIPGQPHSWLEVLVVILIHLAAGSGPDGLEGDRTGVVRLLLEKIRQVPIALERNSVEFVAHSKLKCQIISHLPGILNKCAVFVLNQQPVVARRTRSAGVEKLGLSLYSGHAQQSRRHSL